MYSREEFGNFTAKIDTHTHTHTIQDTICAISLDDTVESFDIKSAARRMFHSVHITDVTILNTECTHIRGEIDSKSFIWIYMYTYIHVAVSRLTCFLFPLLFARSYFFLSRLTSPWLLPASAELWVYVAIFIPILTVWYLRLSKLHVRRDSYEIWNSYKVNPPRVADIFQIKSQPRNRNRWYVHFMHYC